MCRKQIQIKSGDVLNDQRIVENALLTAVEKFSLLDNTVTSRVPNTIRSFVEKDGSRIGIGARIINDLIIVDFNSLGDQSQSFIDIYASILAEILPSFSGSIREATDEESYYIKVYDQSSGSN
jgi:hypothetical protein